MSLVAGSVPLGGRANRAPETSFGAFSHLIFIRTTLSAYEDIDAKKAQDRPETRRVPSQPGSPQPGSEGHCETSCNIDHLLAHSYSPTAPTSTAGRSPAPDVENELSEAEGRVPGLQSQRPRACAQGQTEFNRLGRGAPLHSLQVFSFDLCSFKRPAPRRCVRTA